MDRTSDVDAIALDNIDVLSKWRVEVEMPIMEDGGATRGGGAAAAA